MYARLRQTPWYRRRHRLPLTFPGISTVTTNSTSTAHQFSRDFRCPILVTFASHTFLFSRGFSSLIYTSVAPLTELIAAGKLTDINREVKHAFPQMSRHRHCFPIFLTNTRKPIHSFSMSRDHHSVLLAISGPRGRVNGKIERKAAMIRSGNCARSRKIV